MVLPMRLYILSMSIIVSAAVDEGIDLSLTTMASLLSSVVIDFSLPDGICVVKGFLKVEFNCVVFHKIYSCCLYMLVVICAG